MANPTPVQRAMKMLTENQFLTLATSSGQNVWCAPVAYVIGPGEALHFYSATESVHTRHILGKPQVAASVFNSTARGEDVDGMQMAADCVAVEGNELDTVCEHYFNRLFPDAEQWAWWYRPPAAFTGNGLWRFFRLSPTAAFVIDADNFAETKIDRRTPVDLPSLLQGLKLAGE